MWFLLYKKWANIFLNHMNHFGGNINVKVDLSNYATKKDIKNISHTDTSSFALKSNLSSLKTEIICKNHLQKLSKIICKNYWDCSRTQSHSPSPKTLNKSTLLTAESHNFCRWLSELKKNGKGIPCFTSSKFLKTSSFQHLNWCCGPAGMPEADTAWKRMHGDFRQWFL